MSFAFLLMGLEFDKDTKIVISKSVYRLISFILLLAFKISHIIISPEYFVIY